MTIRHIQPKLTTDQKIKSLRSELRQLQHEYRSANTERLKRRLLDDMNVVLFSIGQMEKLKAKEDTAK